MNKKYILKGLFLIVLIPATVYYFFKMPGSEVTINSFFILFFTVLQVYEEVSLSLHRSDSRNKYQIGIDRILVMLLIAISIDILMSFQVNGLSL
ncbi:hypothetical protein JTF06_13025 [Desemzia sp. RIT804]|uniref:hypothetical protein n=1 Tax=Desemzia sp. RIT 804 TaxID=2810209 RepID=UPI001950D4E9|nr:hypothetical protein [Desemzia sp. RIT 804]MBM6615809.1 hypothetical protein [Desemzia sp. RIT 804]